MNKDTIELSREKDQPYGYSSTRNYTVDSEEVLEAIINWSRNNLEAKIYKHKVRFVYENDNGESYDFSKWIYHDSSIKTTKCDFVNYLDIYWQ